MELISVDDFIDKTASMQNENAISGGKQVYWAPSEVVDMRAIGMAVLDGEFSQASALKRFKWEKIHNRKIGSINPNKSSTAFRDKLSLVVKDLKERAKYVGDVLEDDS